MNTNDNVTLQKFQINLNNEVRNVVVVNYKPVKENKTFEKIHHVHILDRSGSMYYEIDRLIDNVQLTIDYTSEEDLNTISWFSGPGEYRVPLKGARKFDHINDILDPLRCTVSTTCFSEILKEVKEILLNDFNSLEMPVNVTLFTDGNPVVPWSDDEEEKRIFEELNEMKYNIPGIIFNTIGYGNYYNENLLKNIAAVSRSGNFIHSNNIQQYLEIFRNNYEMIKESINDGVNVYAYGLSEIIYLNRQFTKLKSKKLILDSINKRKNQFFILTDGKSFKVNDNEYFIESINNFAQDSTITNFLYAYAYNLYYNGKNDESLNVLANLKDKYLIDSHFISFTYDEKAEHTKKLKSALFDNSERYKDGKCLDCYIPSENSICVMDIIKDLKHNNAYWIPFHKDMEKYNKIGVERKDSFDVFVSDEKEIRANFSDVVFHKKHLNMSLRVKIPGHIQINPNQAKSVNLESSFKCHKYRTYTIVKDGNLNTKKIMCLVPEEYNNGFSIIENDIQIGNEKYVRVVIDLTQFPIINQKYAKEALNIESVFNLMSAILEYECIQKVLNYYLKNLKDIAHLKKEGVFENLNIDQIKLLEEHGIAKDGTYRGVGKEEFKTGDEYRIRVLDFYFAGISSLPSLKDIEKRLKDSKKLTTAMKILNASHRKIIGYANEDKINLIDKKKKTKEWLDDCLSRTKRGLEYNRDKLAIYKMAIVLTGKWFKGLKMDEKGNEYYEQDGKKMICKTGYEIIKL